MTKKEDPTKEDSKETSEEGKSEETPSEEPEEKVEEKGEEDDSKKEPEEESDSEPSEEEKTKAKESLRKFKSNDDLSKSYSEAEKKISQQGTEIAELKKRISKKESETEEKESTPTDDTTAEGVSVDVLRQRLDYLENTVTEKDIDDFLDANPAAAKEDVQKAMEEHVKVYRAQGFPMKQALENSYKIVAGNDDAILKAQADVQKNKEGSISSGSSRDIPSKKVELSDDQKKVAEKLGLTDDEYTEGIIN